jgi:hypothetical protein
LSLHRIREEERKESKDRKSGGSSQFNPQKVVRMSAMRARQFAQLWASGYSA